MLAILGILGLVLLFLITRPFTILFHELGHAIPAIILTKEKVTIYLGSYGSAENSFRINIGMLEIYAKKSILWNSGLCIHSPNISFSGDVITTIGGALFTLIIGIVSTYLIIHFDAHGALKLIAAFFLLSAIFDLYINLTPDKEPIHIYNDCEVYNDGYRLKLLFSGKRFLVQYGKVTKIYDREDYNNAAILMEQLILKFPHVIHQAHLENLYSLLIESLVQIRDFKKALDINQIFIVKYSPSSEDYARSGLIKSYLGLGEESLIDYDKALSIDSENRFALCNKSFQLNLLSRYDEAIFYSNEALHYYPKCAYSYNNRGLAKIYLGRVEDGLKDLHYTIALDANYSYTYLSLGIYNLKMGDKQEALKQFKKAKMLDENTYQIDDHIKSIRI